MFSNFKLETQIRISEFKFSIPVSFIFDFGTAPATKATVVGAPQVRPGPPSRGSYKGVSR